jgi:hypothetical protein
VAIFKSKKPTVESLAQESSAIFDIFTQTQEQCKQLNEKIAVVAQAKQEEADKLLAEVNQLQNISKKNENLANKITQFLNS